MARQLNRFQKLGLIIFFFAAGLMLPAHAGQGDPLEGAGRRIEKIRTREVRILVREGQRPVSGATFRAEMKRHQFLFGCNLYMFGKLPGPEANEKYLKLWSDLFNYATLPFYLSTYQPEPNRTEEEYLWEMVSWCRENKVTAKGHPLIWHFPGANPGWLPRDPDRMEELLQSRVKDIIETFSPEIRLWDLLNEPTTAWMYDTPVGRWENREGPLEACKKGLEWAAAADPGAVLLINDYNVRFGFHSFLDLLHPARAMKLLLADPTRRYPHSFNRLMKDLKEAGGEYHAVGLQTHMHMGGNWSMAKIWETCERYSGLGVPIHFTEVTVLSGTNKVMWPFNPEVNLPWPTTEKGEARQADYVEQFYTLLFSHPSVQAVTWWDFTDYDAWMGAPAGLVRADLSPKPAYERLIHLVKDKWWTRFEGRTDRSGQAGFRGFCGDYQVWVAGRGEAVPFTIDCNKAEGQVIELEI